MSYWDVCNNEILTCIRLSKVFLQRITALHLAEVMSKAMIGILVHEI